MTKKTTKKTTKNKGGRPLKFKTAKELQEKIEEYFSSCFKPVYNKRLTDEYRKRTKKISPTPNPVEEDYEWVPELDHEGNLVYTQETPFTVTGLALHLGTTRDLLLDYEEKEEFSDTIKEAKLKIHQYAEEYLFNGKNQTSAIFNLKNNWGWKEKSEVIVDTPVTDETRERAQDAINDYLGNTGEGN
jgi:hypothetical protein